MFERMRKAAEIANETSEESSEVMENNLGAAVFTARSSNTTPQNNYRSQNKGLLLLSGRRVPEGDALESTAGGGDLVSGTTIAPASSSASNTLLTREQQRDSTSLQQRMTPASNVRIGAGKRPNKKPGDTNQNAARMRGVALLQAAAQEYKHQGVRQNSSNLKASASGNRMQKEAQNTTKIMKSDYVSDDEDLLPIAALEKEQDTLLDQDRARALQAYIGTENAEKRMPKYEPIYEGIQSAAFIETLYAFANVECTSGYKTLLYMKPGWSFFVMALGYLVQFVVIEYIQYDLSGPAVRKWQDGYHKLVSMQLGAALDDKAGTNFAQLPGGADLHNDAKVRTEEITTYLKVLEKEDADKICDWSISSPFMLASLIFLHLIAVSRELADRLRLLYWLLFVAPATPDCKEAVGVVVKKELAHFNALQLESIRTDGRLSNSADAPEVRDHMLDDFFEIEPELVIIGAPLWAKLFYALPIILPSFFIALFTVFVGLQYYIGTTHADVLFNAAFFVILAQFDNFIYVTCITRDQRTEVEMCRLYFNKRARDAELGYVKFSAEMMFTVITAVLSFSVVAVMLPNLLADSAPVDGYRNASWHREFIFGLRDYCRDQNLRYVYNDRWSVRDYFVLFRTAPNLNADGTTASVQPGCCGEPGADAVEVPDSSFVQQVAAGVGAVLGGTDLLSTVTSTTTEILAAVAEMANHAATAAAAREEVLGEDTVVGSSASGTSTGASTGGTKKRSFWSRLFNLPEEKSDKLQFLAPRGEE
ncbi:unnamed protein product [Amoebophrya sp. A120]|nr:unnamed protein product [Amoebophrya sp. A120]|eukprot:GSA120T00009072001.1